MSEKKKYNLPFWILIALLGGIAVGVILWLALGAEAAAGFTEKYVKPVGDIFIGLLKWIVVPVVLLSIMDGVIAMNDIRKVGKIGGQTVVYFLVTTLIACVIGLLVANIFKGAFPNLAGDLGEQTYTGATSNDWITVIKNIFPSNAVDPFSKSIMLQVIVIAIFFGCGIIVAGEKGELAGKTVSSFNEVTQRVMMFIINVSPIAIFCTMAWVVSAKGPAILTSYAIVLGVAYLGYILHAALVYSLSVKIFANMSPLVFFKKIWAAMAFAFASTSSVATLPITKECCDDMGVDSEVSSFVLPLGATINMDGTAIYQCVCALFIASCAGFDLTLGNMITIALTATLASIGTAGVSGAGFLMLAMVLQACNVPIDYIMLVYAIDRLFDMGRTTLNIVGDASCAVCVNKWVGKKEEKAA